MIKQISILILISFSLFTLSCRKEKKETIINITVKDAVGVKDNFSVYMFNKTTWGAHGAVKSFADKVVVTGDDGVASFKLSNNLDLEINDAQTTFYFTCFYTKEGDDNTYVANVGATIEEEETVDKVINLN